MPDEKATEPHISNYAPDELVTKAMNAGRGFSGAVHVYTRDEASSKFDYFVRLFEHILSGLKWLLPIEPGSVYFAFVGGGVPFRAARVERDAFVILADPRAINYAMILTSRLQVLGPMARRFKTESVEPTKDYSGMYLLDIAKDLIFHEELVRESTEVNGITTNVFVSLLCYVVCHEYAHIAHGHLDFRLSDDFREFTATQQNRELTARALELDADASAVTSTFALFEHLFLVDIKPRIPAELVEELTAQYRLQYLLGITLAHIYLDSLAVDHVPKYHPMTYVRFVGFQMVLLKVGESQGIDSDFVEEARKLVADTFVHLSGDVSNLHHPIAANFLVQEGEGELVGEYNELGFYSAAAQLEDEGRRWARLYPILAKFLRGGRLAPPYADPL
ncbi:hypothetical protein [Rhizobium leguminosarum]|uniref:hypothetical protein n=1 Tax=Rhizobium leguminosarum TaxID=384 RepID=UPI00103B58F8|nr:hypothetical protein [Rhizobium leguminosarum]TBZ17070.1 hypothetical protein E0H33_11740 [Rhizobium leguminosarum bv. viciae]